MIQPINNFQEAVELVRRNGGGTCGWQPADAWPRYSPQETDAVDRLEHEERKLQQVNKWALEHLGEETASCAPGELLDRWRDFGIVIRRACERYEQAERATLAELEGGGA